MSHWKNTIFSILGTFDDSIRFYLVLLFLLGICHVCRKPCRSFPWSTLSVRSSRPKPSTEPGAQLLNFSLTPALSDLLLIRNASLRPGHVRRATCTGPLGPMCSTETKGINLPGLAKNYRFSFRHTIWHCTFELVLHRMIPFMETVKESKTQHLKRKRPIPRKGRERMEVLKEVARARLQERFLGCPCLDQFLLNWYNTLDPMCILPSAWIQVQQTLLKTVNWFFVKQYY